jgi:hypothetical protein
MTLRDRLIRTGNPAALAAFARGDIENALVASTPGGIEAQEARGQADLTRRFNQLPKEYGRGEFPAELLVRLGFTAQGPVDDLFIGVTAPAGWQLRPTSHSMHSEIVDDKGRVRGGVFYKAAFYDRKASFHLNTRYCADTEYEPANGRKWDECSSRAVVKDQSTGETLLACEWQKNSARDYTKSDADRAKCVAHLDQNFPDWTNVEAYW